MRRWMAGAMAFVRRDFQVALSYRVPFVFDFIGVFFVVFELYFLSKIVPDGGVTGDYLAFVVTGLVVTTFLISGASVIANAVRQEQVQGTLEVTLSAGLSLPRLAVGMSVYPMAAGAARAAVYAGLAASLGARIPGANWGLAVVATVLGSISFVAIGLMGVALVLAIRQASGAIAWALGAATLLAGVLFPVELLPGWLRVVSGWSPATWTLQTVRAALGDGGSLASEWRSLALLAAMGVAFTALALGALSWSLHHTRRTGSLSLY